MAMINDKGPEESRDTDATYIILSHQSVHLPGPSQQRGNGKEEEEGKGWGKGKKKHGGESYLLPVFLYTGIALLLFFSWEKVKKQVTKR